MRRNYSKFNELLNHDTGKSYKLNSNDCMQIQDMVAESLGMERGTSKDETGAEHLNRNDYILLKQKKELNELKEQTEEAQNDLQSTIDDCNLLQAEKEYARETLQDLRQEAADMELHRADTEVRDIVEGKYDWRIERFENHRGDGLSV